MEEISQFKYPKYRWAVLLEWMGVSAPYVQSITEIDGSQWE